MEVLVNNCSHISDLYSNRTAKRDLDMKIYPQFFTAIFALLLSLSAPLASAQTYTVLVNLVGQTPQVPNVGPAFAQARDGILYGTSSNGGLPFNDGTLFSLTASGALTTVYTFDNNTVGQYPYGGVTLGSDGQLYGALYRQGAGGFGAVYKITTAGTFTTLHSFTNTGDGAEPQSAPIQGVDGNFYGTTTGWDFNSKLASSTIYKITSAGVFTTLHTLTVSEGSLTSGLMQGTDGNLYGVTNQGGANGFGTIFKVTPGGVFTVLHTFINTEGNGQSQTNLVQASDGKLYGSSTGGTFGVGTIFSVTTNGTFTILHSLNGNPEGAYPIGPLIIGTDGVFRGVAFTGGTFDYGTIFKITTAGVFTKLWDFNTASGSQDGGVPGTGPILATSGLLYGSTTVTTGLAEAGVLYSLNDGEIANAAILTASGKIGTKVGILGQGFSAATVVKFGGVTATTVTRVGSTYLTATVPVGAHTGTVTAATGATTLTTVNKFHVLPTLTTFTPSSGPVGTVVTINGTGLTQTTAVTFNGLAATSFAVLSDSQITATVPTGATTGKIKVTTSGGSVSTTTSFIVN